MQYMSILFPLYVHYIHSMVDLKTLYLFLPPCIVLNVYQSPEVAPGADRSGFDQRTTRGAGSGNAETNG